MRTTWMFVASAAVALSLVSSSKAQPSANGHRGVTVMTRNLYLGADLAPVMLAPDFPAVVAAVTQAWMDVQATDFGDRVVGLADEIEAAHPDLVGLQEAALWRIQEYGDILLGGNVPATDVAYDFVAMLLDELASRGERYEIAVSQDAMDVELPNAFGQDIRLTDRDVVLVRRHAAGQGPVKILGTSSGTFQALLQLPVGGPGGPVVTVTRGWVAVDAKLHGETFRFVNTHLEDDIAPPVQEAQAYELLDGPLAVDGAVICLGDFNSDAFGSGTASYEILLDGGLDDAWTLSGGATWGHAADLLNPLPTLTQRLDLVLHDASFVVEDTDTVGDEVGDVTAGGLWPSDHAGVVVSFTFARP